jgi:hypothetical protein
MFPKVREDWGDIVFTVKVADDCPAATMTVVGTVAALFELVSMITVSTAVTPERVTVPVEEPPALICEGERRTDTKSGVRTVKCAVFVRSPNVALTATTVLSAAGDTVSGKVALDARAGMVTVAGVVTRGLEEARVTVIPPSGASADNVTRPVQDVPPSTLVGLTLTLLRTGAFKVRVVDTDIGSVVAVT